MMVRPYISGCYKVFIFDSLSASSYQVNKHIWGLFNVQRGGRFKSAAKNIGDITPFIRDSFSKSRIKDEYSKHDIFCV